MKDKLYHKIISYLNKNITIDLARLFNLVFVIILTTILMSDIVINLKCISTDGVFDNEYVQNEFPKMNFCAIINLNAKAFLLFCHIPLPILLPLSAYYIYIFTFYMCSNKRNSDILIQVILINIIILYVGATFEFKLF